MNHRRKPQRVCGWSGVRDGCSQARNGQVSTGGSSPVCAAETGTSRRADRPGGEAEDGYPDADRRSNRRSGEGCLSSRGEPVGAAIPTRMLRRRSTGRAASARRSSLSIWLLCFPCAHTLRAGLPIVQKRWVVDKSHSLSGRAAPSLGSRPDRVRGRDRRWSEIASPGGFPTYPVGNHAGCTKECEFPGERLAGGRPR